MAAWMAAPVAAAGRKNGRMPCDRSGVIAFVLSVPATASASDAMVAARICDGVAIFNTPSNRAGNSSAATKLLGADGTSPK
jgi:hypothetical protein